MQTDIDQQGPWLSSTDQRVRELFVEHVRKSPYPEDFEGVARGIKPPRDRNFRIVKKHVCVDPKKRKSDLAPCNLCGPKPKFKNDGMLIVDEMGWLYLIGPICGEQHYEGRFRDEERRFDRAQAERTAAEFLLSEISEIQNWQKKADALREPAEASYTAHQRLKKTGDVVKFLRRAINQQDGWLTVTEELQVLQSNGEHRTEFHDLRISRIDGAAAVRSNCKITARLKEATRILNAFGNSEDCALNLIASEEANGRLPELASSLRGAIAALGEVCREIEEFQAFFSEDNYQAIELWVSDERCPKPIEIDYRGSRRTLVADNARRRITINVAELMVAIPDVD